MLEEVRIRGLGVIDDATLPLSAGLTVVTGETGAGKTMVVSGLLLLFGERADSSQVSASATAADIEGRLRLDPASAAVARALEAGGAIDDDGTLILSRTVSKEGRSRATVGGRSAPAGVLADIAETVLAVHGQAAQLRLTRPAQQRDLLDRFAGADASAVKAEYADAFAVWRSAVGDLVERRSHQAERARESEMLQFALGQIDVVRPQEAEDEELDGELRRLSNADALRQATSLGQTALVGAEATSGADAANVDALLGRARRALDDVAESDPALATLSARVHEVAYLVADIAAELATYSANVEDDPIRLEAAMQRRSELKTLVSKYSDSTAGIAGVLDWAKQARSKLEGLDSSDEALAQLQRELDQAAEVAAKYAGQLSSLRADAASRFGAQVTGELAHLAMGSAQISVTVQHRPPVVGGATLSVGGAPSAATADGIDEVAIELVSHDGGQPRPLAKGASGGELSRVMLAIEVVLAGADPVSTMIFDEVDSGVGGQAAVEIGRRLADLGRSHQVLAVTHLPQVAAYADQHVVIEKSTSGAVTKSGIALLDEDQRVVELTRMLAGLVDSDSGRAHARELLDSARTHKAQHSTATSKSKA